MRNKKWLLSVIVFQGLCLAEEIPPYKKHFFSLITQNDSYFNVFVDRYYSAGHGLLYSSPEGDYGVLDQIGLLKGGATSWSLAFTQSIYTPKNRKNAMPYLDDHPYGGYLNMGLLLHHRKQNSLENLGLHIGVVGKYTGAEEVQGFVHSIFDTVILKGWHTQIGNELIFNLHYDYTYRYEIASFNGLSMDILPYVDLALGNANIYAKGGAFLRIGHHLQSSFLPQGIAGENGGSNSGRVYADGLGYYLFVGSYGGYVMRNIFIQGNSFGDNFHRADLIKWIGGVSAGVAIVSGVMSFSYQALYTSKEFKKQDKPHGVGSFVFSWSF